MIGDEELLEEALLIKERKRREKRSKRQSHESSPKRQSQRPEKGGLVSKAAPDQVLTLKRDSTAKSLATVSSAKNLADSSGKKTGFGGPLSFGKKNKAKDEQTVLSN